VLPELCAPGNRSVELSEAENLERRLQHWEEAYTLAMVLELAIANLDRWT